MVGAVRVGPLSAATVDEDSFSVELVGAVSVSFDAAGASGPGADSVAVIEVDVGSSAADVDGAAFVGATVVGVAVTGAVSAGADFSAAAVPGVGFPEAGFDAADSAGPFVAAVDVEGKDFEEGDFEDDVFVDAPALLEARVRVGLAGAGVSAGSVDLSAEAAELREVADREDPGRPRRSAAARAMSLARSARLPRSRCGRS